MSRVRRRYQTEVNGSWKKAGTGPDGKTFNRLDEQVTDEIIGGDCHPFYVSRFQSTGGVAHDIVPNGFYSTTVRNYCVDAITGNWGQCWGPITSYPGELPKAVYAAQAVSRTNPSRAYVDIPVNVLELGDITTLLKKSGDTLIRKLASNNLRYQFGIRPLVEDVIKLTKFQDAVHRRIKEMEKLKGPHGLRRTLELDNLTATIDRSNTALQTAGFTLSRVYSTIGRRQIKAHVRWKAGGNFDKINQPEMCALATKAVLGLTLDFATFWEAMPWSWMIDWGSNVGDYFKANRNIVPATLEGCWLSTHTTSTSDVPAITTGNRIFSAAKVVLEQKQREYVAVTPTAHFPFLSGNQLGILASLAITRS